MRRQVRLGGTFVLALATVFAVTALIAKTKKPAPKPTPAAGMKLPAGLSAEAKACVTCHLEHNPGLVVDWLKSTHAGQETTCLECHRAAKNAPGVSSAHEAQYRGGKWGKVIPITAVVSPKKCGECHEDQVAQYARSKMANTLRIISKLDHGLPVRLEGRLERKTGCLVCHGTIVKIKAGRVDRSTWPSVGVGRKNPDGSLGSCSSCHTRHRFSRAEARRPEACKQCHMGPDHPQYEVFMESKHGAMYVAQGGQYKWGASADDWRPGIAYRAPTCATCHFSRVGKVKGTHDATERLAWEVQTPRSIRPENFKPWPAKIKWQQARANMKGVCGHCHSPGWVDSFFADYDKVNVFYNTKYYDPAARMMKKLYARGLLDKKRFFDERLEQDFYKLWHYPGIRARTGAAMGGPVYTWWVGFYDLKVAFPRFMRRARALLKSGKKAKPYKLIPGAYQPHRLPY
ncbi:MAG: cytochrome c3 family protein [Proteobacteria bacterium]|nr:cytochrome c3 family protein [Pseudomonadota bacterium]MBU1741633.1 cytochrome c3 family protein [Pseudomonadota bacterium]